MNSDWPLIFSTIHPSFHAPPHDRPSFVATSNKAAHLPHERMEHGRFKIFNPRLNTHDVEANKIVKIYQKNIRWVIIIALNIHSRPTPFSCFVLSYLVLSAICFDLLSLLSVLTYLRLPSPLGPCLLSFVFGLALCFSALFLVALVFGSEALFYPSLSTLWTLASTSWFVYVSCQAGFLSKTKKRRLQHILSTFKTFADSHKKPDTRYDKTNN